MFISLTSNRLLSLYLEYLAYTLKKKIQKIAHLFKQYFNNNINNTLTDVDLGQDLPTCSNMMAA